METPSSSLNDRLHSVWKRTQTKHFCAALLAFAAWAVPIFLLGILLDRFTYLPPLGRAVILLGLLGVSFYRAWKQGARLLRGFDAMRSAQQIESQRGDLDSLLSTAVQFRDQGATPGTSASLWEASLRKANEAVSDLRAADIIRYATLKRPFQTATAMLLIIAVVAIVNGPFLAAGFARIFNPWSSIAYPTKTKIEMPGRLLVLKEGDAAKIEATLSGSVPQNTKLELVTGEGRPKDIVLEVRNDKAVYAIASASRDFRYRIKAGDARSDWNEVRVVPAPRIAEAKLLLQYPEYQKRPEETVEAMTLTVPEGTQVKWQLKLDQPIAKALLHRDGEEPLDLEVRNEGRELIVEERVLASRGYHFSWVEKNHGFSFDSPRYHLQVSADEAPRLEFVAPATNVFAMLGRQLDFIVRAQDDHGIATTTITYHVNLRPEKTVTLGVPLRSAEGEQKLDWDYRKEIPDLQVGDSVSFILEIADTYPGPQGAHRVRTDARRITVLSREDYLAQINAKMDRLLTRIRAIYRQARAAHMLVRGLNPADESFPQTCQLEAIRQEMLREQLNLTAAETRLLLDDLAANNLTDAANNTMLKYLADGMESVAEKSIAKAANLLRAQAGQGNSIDPITAAITVNQAARELSALVMQRGIDAAREVFALETQMLSLEQTSLRARCLTTTDKDAIERLAQHQDEVAAWTTELLEKIHATMRYEQRPLSVLHLIRRMSDLRASDAIGTMRKAADHIRKGDAKAAAQLQTDITKALLDAEFSVRTGAEYAAVTNAQKTLKFLLEEQQKHRAEREDANSDTIDPSLIVRQQALQTKLLHLLLPEPPAPRTRLFSATKLEAPPIDSIRTDLESAMAQSLAHLKAGKREDAITSQRASESRLTGLNKIASAWAADIAMRTEGISTLASLNVKRLSIITEIETRQIQLIEQAEEAALDEKPTKPLTENQLALANDLQSFKKELLDDDKTTANKDLHILINRIDIIEKLMATSAAALSANNGEDALIPIEKAANALAVLKEMIQSQTDRVALLQEIFGFQRSVGNAGLTMADLVQTQNELIAATEGAEEAELEKLLPTIKNLHQCINDVAPLFDLVASRLDVGSALLFAGSDIEDAIAALEDGDPEDALDAQEAAAESLAKVQGLILSVSEQNGYLGEIMEFLNEALADISLMQSGQEAIRLAIEAAPQTIAPDLAKRQIDLQSSADSFAMALAKTTGMQDFHKAAPAMTDAASAMKANDSAAALEAITKCDAALTALSEQIVIIMGVLHGLSSIEVLSTSPPELPELIEVLALASDQKTLHRSLLFDKNSALGTFTPRQQKLLARYAKYTEKETPHPLLVTARQQAELATAATSRDQALASLDANADTLRHFVISQAVLLNTVVVPSAPSSDPVVSEAETDDLTVSDVASLVSDFVSGEAPKDRRSEWETLGTRNRAALNQNFARELPLEYRAMLKNYYEKVAK
jgi:hypothetical protein